MCALSTWIKRLVCYFGRHGPSIVHFRWCTVTRVVGFHSKLLFRTLKLCANCHSLKNRCNQISKYCTSVLCFMNQNISDK